MTDVITPPLPLSIHGLAASILAMCEAHDLPIDQLPGLWDKYTNLQQVERRAGIQNGNMERELMRLRELTHEQEKSLQDYTNELQLYRTRIADLEETEGHLRCRVRELEGFQDKQFETIDNMQVKYNELGDKYEALLLRCKHFEELANPKRIDDLEDLIAHYRSGMQGMNELAANKHFSNDWRLWLITRTLNVFEPSVKEKGLMDA